MRFNNHGARTIAEIKHNRAAKTIERHRKLLDDDFIYVKDDEVFIKLNHERCGAL